MEAPGISFQETTASTVAASTIWLWNTLQTWQGDAASWYPVKSLFRRLWAISHRIRGGVHPRHSFLSFHSFLSVHDRVIFKGQRWIIPQTLRQKIKQKLHDSHIGLQGCLCRAQETVYWPGMNAKITDYIQKCKVCMSLQSNQTKEPLTCHEPTSRPWEKVATDIFMLDDKNCLCTVDYYSGYFEVYQLHSKTATVIIKKLKRHFVTQGTPNELLSGNEPPFNSAEFENFLWSSGTEHVTSSPCYPQSNGRGEITVKTAKSLIKKAN